jgi:NitT/TauT family transport system substrate-binding protein
VTFDPYRVQLLRAGATTLFDSTQIPGEIVDLVAVRAACSKAAQRGPALLSGWFAALEYMKLDPKDAARRMGIRSRRAASSSSALKGLHIPSRDENLKMLGGAAPELALTGRRLMTLMLEAKLLREEAADRKRAGARPLANLPP